MIKKKWAHILY